MSTSTRAKPAASIMGRYTPRIFRAADPSPATWAEALGQAATLGFDTLLVPGAEPPAALLEAAQGLNIAVLATLQLDQAPPGWTAGGPFRRLPAPTLDPRRPPTPAAEAMATLIGPPDIARLLEAWNPRLAALAKAGVAGIRLLGLPELPGWAVAPLLEGLRARSGDLLLVAATPGLSWALLDTLPRRCVDAVESSLAHWNGHADWLWQELERLRRIAPVIASAEANAGVRPAWGSLAAIL
ncbi:MAG: hypothetical protein ACRYGM_07700, partial [Janthinobacterium lividum]